MKKYVLLFALFVSSLSYGQHYKLVPDTCTLCMYFWGQSGSTLYQSSYHIDPTQDTIIDTHNYVKILGAVRPEQPSFIRQEGNRLYARHNDSISDYLVMDFDAEVGDTLFNLVSEGVVYNAKVMVKDSFLLNDGSYNTYMDLNAFEYTYGGSWVQDYWYFSWSEGGLCNIHDAPEIYGLGGVLYNVPEYIFQGLEVAYYSPSYCTLDSNYTMLNGSTCEYCVGESGYNDLTKNELQLFELYPNPAKETIELLFKTEGTKDIEIVNLLGERRFVAQSHTNNLTLNVSELQAGCYFVIVRENGNSYSQKVIVGR